jgi:hypothetical protein
MFFYFAVLFVSVYFLIKLYEYKLQYTVVHQETGKPLPFHGSFLSPFLNLFSTTSEVRKTIKDLQNYEEIFGTTHMFRYRVSTSSPEIAKTVLTDQKNFQKENKSN